MDIRQIKTAFLRVGMSLPIVLFSYFEPAYVEAAETNQTCGAEKTARLDGRSEYLAIARCEAAKEGLPQHIAAAVIEIESRFNPRAVGNDGEIGLMQVMPATAAMLGFSGTLDDLADPRTNIKLGVRYLAGAYRLAGGDLCTTVMKYRAGHGETRFSVLSVRYCDRARRILAREGVEVKGDLPAPTFGFDTGSSRSSGGTCLRRSFKPGPGYGRCLSGGGATKSAVAARRALFN